MGFLKDVARLHKMGRDARSRMDVAGSFAQMQATLDQTNAMFSANAVAQQASTSPVGVEGTATVLAARHTGTTINLASVIEIELLVMTPSGVPVQASLTTPVQPLHLASLEQGRKLAVRFDPQHPTTTVVIDWARVA